MDIDNIINIELLEEEKRVIYQFVNEEKRDLSKNKIFKYNALQVLKIITQYNTTKESRQAILNEFDNMGIEFTKEEITTLFNSNEKYLEEIIKKNKQSKNQLLNGVNDLLKVVYHNKKIAAKSIEQVFKELIYFKNNQLMEFKSIIELYIVTGDYDNDFKKGLYDKANTQEDFLKIFFENINTHLREVKDKQFVKSNNKFQFENNKLTFKTANVGEIDMIYEDHKGNVFACDITSDVTGTIDFKESKSTIEQTLNRHAKIIEAIKHNQDKEKNYYFISQIPRSINSSLVATQQITTINNKRTRAFIQEMMKHYHIANIADDNTTYETFKEYNTLINTFAYRKTGHDGFKIMDTQQIKYSCEDITKLFLSIKNINLDENNLENNIELNNEILIETLKNNKELKTSHIFKIAQNLNQDLTHERKKDIDEENYALLTNVIKLILQNENLMHFLANEFYWSLQFDKITHQEAQEFYKNVFSKFVIKKHYLNLNTLKLLIMNKRLEEEAFKLSKTNDNLTKENTNLVEENTNLVEENTNLVEENTNLVEENTNLVEKAKSLKQEALKLSEEKNNIEEETLKIKLAYEKLQNENKVKENIINFIADNHINKNTQQYKYKTYEHIIEILKKVYKIKIEQVDLNQIFETINTIFKIELDIKEFKTQNLIYQQSKHNINDNSKKVSIANATKQFKCQNK